MFGVQSNESAGDSMMKKYGSYNGGPTIIHTNLFRSKGTPASTRRIGTIAASVPDNPASFVGEIRINRKKDELFKRISEEGLKSQMLEIHRQKKIQALIGRLKNAIEKRRLKTSRVRAHSQNITTAARAQADMKMSAHLS